MIPTEEVKWADRLFAKAVQCSLGFDGNLGNDDGRFDVDIELSGLSYFTLVWLQMKGQGSSDSNWPS
jgi:hypothetical protein